MLADVMQSFQDPEIVAEAKKMMADPHFQAKLAPSHSHACHARMAT